MRIVRTPRHTYALVDDAGAVVEGWYPGATSILGVVAKPALVTWARRETAKAAVRELATLSTMLATGTEDAAVSWLASVADKITGDAAGRGTDVHAIVERIASGEAVDVPQAAAGYVAGWEAWRERFGPTFRAVEAPVLSTSARYGGTIDAVALDRDGTPWLLDWKTSKAVYDTHVLQLAAYASADLIAPDLGAEAVAMPPLDRAAVVLLRADGTYAQVEVRIGESERSAFLAARRLRDYLDTDARSAIEPATGPHPLAAVVR